MKIRITSPVKGPGKNEEHKIGEVIDVSEKIAEGLFAAKSAERFTPEDAGKREPAPPPGPPPEDKPPEGSGTDKDKTKEPKK